MLNTETYSKSGVSIAAGEALVERIRQDNPAIGGFAGLYALDEERSLVACTDGVGTKLEISIQMGRFEELGQDLVAMSVNDLVVCGARPLFFLDYYATGKLDVEVAHRVIKGIQKACAESGCILLGGETAEMPGFYEGNKFDLAGFAVGEVKNSEVIDGSKVKAGDVIMGLPSSGFHANGFSLVRKIIADNQLPLNSVLEETGRTLGEELSTPTALYVKPVLKLTAALEVKAMAHITGGGLTNIQRTLPKGLTYDIDKKNIRVPAVMRYLKELGNISDEEAYTVWNMGLGFVFVVSAEDVELAQKLMPSAFVAGRVTPQ